MIVRRLSVAVALVSAAFVVAGCGSADDAAPSGGDATVTTTPSPPAADVTTINGQVPPGPATAVTESITLLDVVDDGLQHLVYRDTREPGTRSPIHEHPYGGTTCVLSGQMTLYLEGAEPQVANEGDCYWMPPGLPMTGVSSGTDYAVMIDNFTVPPGEPVWWVVEPGQEDLADHNFGGGGGSGHM